MMKRFKKPIIVVSECLGFSACRYDGGKSESRCVQELAPFVEFIPVCPETAIGLGIPRIPIWMVQDGTALRLLQEETQVDLTAKMEDFANRFLDSLPLIDGFILKSRSPSCGTGDCKLLDSLDNRQAPIGRVDGCFAAIVRARYPDVPLESETSLKDAAIRENFLHEIFTPALKRMI